MRRFACLFAAACVLSLLSIPHARANPQGPQVVHGRASFSNPDAHTLNITNDPDTIINWQGFSIQKNEITRFLQQSSQSAVLNRVVGNDLSEILGQLLSNGRVFLINPHGIVFGPDAVVDTAGFVASTLNMTDEDFLRGNYHFEGGPESGSILNQGVITASAGGDVYLIAPEIENSGVVQTDGGELVLAAGQSVTITGAGRDEVLFEVQAPEDRVLNLGKLLADGGAIGVFAGTLTHAGEIRADTVSRDETGSVVLHASHNTSVEAGSLIRASGPEGGTIAIESQSGDAVVQGRVEAVGEAGQGGTIHVLGERVGLWGEALLDASGETGGGEVLVGGDFRGQGDVHRSQHTVMGPEAAIRANAGTSGDGGKVVVWADGTTQAHGTIESRGGAQSGDGGLVEVSGKENLAFEARVDTSAPAGDPGTILLDPATLTIIDGAGPGDQDGNLPTIGFGDPDTLNNEISEQALEALVGDVFIEADGQVTINDLSDDLLDMGGVADGNRFTISSFTGGGVEFLDANDEIRTNGGEIWIGAWGFGNLTNIGLLTVDSPSTGGTDKVYLFSDGGSMTLMGDINVSGPGPPFIGVTLEADNITIDPACQITADTLFIHPWNYGTPVDVGGADAAGVLGLDSTDLTNHNVPVLEVKFGLIDVTAPINFGAWINFVLRSTGALTVQPGASITTSDAIGLQGSEIDILSGPGSLSANNVISLEPLNNQPFSLGTTGTAALDLDATDLAALSTGVLSITAWSNDLPMGVNAPIAIPASITNRVVLRQNVGNADLDINAALTSPVEVILDSDASINVNAPVTAPQIRLRPDAGAGEVVMAADLNAPTVNLELGTLRGTGTIAGNLALSPNTTLAPGASPGTLNVTGNLTLNATSTLQAELGGTGQGTTYDWINVSGAASLDGTLDVSLWGGFTPAGDTFDILSYTSAGGSDFAAKNFPAGYGFAGGDLGTIYRLTTSGGAAPPASPPGSPPAPSPPVVEPPSSAPPATAGQEGASKAVDPLLTLASSSQPGGAEAGPGGSESTLPATPSGDGLIPAFIEAYDEPEGDVKKKPCITCK